MKNQNSARIPIGKSTREQALSISERCDGCASNRTLLRELLLQELCLLEDPE